MKPTLLILAAGMGSRYGGLKQIDPVGPTGEILIDYSIYDAIRAGFGKLVFIIRHSFEDDFRKIIGSKFENVVQVEYAFQELDILPEGHEVPDNREKPWGTTHAILMAEDAINEPFAVINADDYYGDTAFRLQRDFLTSTGTTSTNYSMVGYTLSKTLSDFGSVARGICETDDASFLKAVVEHTSIEMVDGTIKAADYAGNSRECTGEELVSMNLWGFTPTVFGKLHREFGEFMRDQGTEMKSECLIPVAVDTLLAKKDATVKVLPSPDAWFGVTYQSDKAPAMARVRELIDRGLYPENLWGNAPTVS
jgi:UTP-glucose-1-phosphate uridylyltransferase